MTALISLGSIGLMEVEIIAFVISVPISISVPMPRFTNSHLELASLFHFLHNFTQSSTKIFLNVRPLADCLLIKKHVIHVLLFGKVIAIFRIFFRLALFFFKMMTEKATFLKADNSLH